MVTTVNPYFMSKLTDLEHNNITPSGILQFLPMKLEQLHTLGLCYTFNNSVFNNIGSKGAKLLTKATIPSIKNLSISKKLLT
jgi:hypothetical protein